MSGRVRPEAAATPDPVIFYKAVVLKSLLRLNELFLFVTQHSFVVPLAIIQELRQAGSVIPAAMEALVLRRASGSCEERTASGTIGHTQRGSMRFHWLAVALKFVLIAVVVKALLVLLVFPFLAYHWLSLRRTPA